MEEVNPYIHYGSNKSAFTLIELMLAIAIFSVIAAAAYSALRTCINAQKIGEENAEMQREAQIALDAITKDLMATFTSAKPFNTGFIAEDNADGELDRDALVFVTSSHIVYPDPQMKVYGEMDLAQVGYYIPDENKAEEIGKQGLLRHENAILSWQNGAKGAGQQSKEWYGEDESIIELFDDVEAKPVEIAPHAISLDFKFYDGDDWQNSDNWQDSWDSTSNNKLPQAVEVTIGIIKPRFYQLDTSSIDETMFDLFSTVVRIPVAGSEPPMENTKQQGAENENVFPSTH